MRKLGGGKGNAIMFKSHREIVARLNLAASRLAAMGRTHDGRAYKTGHLVSAVALWLGNLGDEELWAATEPMDRALEAWLRGEDPPPGPGRLRADDPPPDLVPPYEAGHTVGKALPKQEPPPQVDRRPVRRPKRQ